MPPIFHTNKQRLPRRKRSCRRAVRRMGGSKKDEPVKMTLLKKADGKDDRAKVDAFFKSSRAEKIKQISTITPETLERYINMWKSMSENRFYFKLESFQTKTDVNIPTFKQYFSYKAKGKSSLQHFITTAGGGHYHDPFASFPRFMWALFVSKKGISQYECVYYTFWSHFLKECKKPA